MPENQDIRKRIRYLNIKINSLVEELFSGSYASIFKGFGLEFSEIREYIHGDDLRTIDWNVFARTGKLHSKKYQEERELAIMIIVDCSASMLEANLVSSKADHLLVLFALFGFAAVQNNDKVGSVLFHKDIANFYPPRRGRQYVMQQLRSITRELEHGEENSGTNMALALRAVAQRMRRRGVCIILSDFLHQGYNKELALLAHRHDVIAIRLQMEEHANFPNVGLVHMKDLETKEQRSFWGLSHGLRRRYHDFWQRQEEQWKLLCNATKVDHYTINTNESPEKKLYEYISRRQRKK